MTKHDCDRKVGRHLSYAENGWPFPGKKVYWVMMVVGPEGGAAAIPIWFCPVCGEKLEVLGA